jgi:hypothetical protein
MKFLKAWGRLKHLLFCKAFLKCFILQLKELTSWVGVFIFDLSRCKRVNACKVRFVKLSWSWRICVEVSCLCYWFSLLVFRI